MTIAQNHRKVVITGTGAVGVTYAYALLGSGLAEEIALVDINQKLVDGLVLDLAHASALAPAVTVKAGSAADYADAALIVVTAGTAQKPGETRLDLLTRNARIMRGIATQIKASGSSATVVIVANPVDILTRIAAEVIGDSQRVFGSGTVLDSARFKFFLSKHCRVDMQNIHAYIIGEHGDSEIAAWSLCHVGGCPLDVICDTCGKCQNNLKSEIARNALLKEVRESAYHIIGAAGATCYGIGTALVRITQAVLRDQHTILTVSTVLHGEYGISDVAISIPAVVGRTGIERILTAPYNTEELAGLRASAAVLQEHYNSIA